MKVDGRHYSATNTYHAIHRLGKLRQERRVFNHVDFANLGDVDATVLFSDLKCEDLYFVGACVEKNPRGIGG